jgi:hypothetical protein
MPKSTSARTLAVKPDLNETKVRCRTNGSGQLREHEIVVNILRSHMEQLREISSLITGSQLDRQVDASLNANNSVWRHTNFIVKGAITVKDRLSLEATCGWYRSGKCYDKSSGKSVYVGEMKLKSAQVSQGYFTKNAANNGLMTSSPSLTNQPMNATLMRTAHGGLVYMTHLNRQHRVHPN